MNTNTVLWQLALVNLKAIGTYECGVVFVIDGERRVYQNGGWFDGSFQFLLDAPVLTFNDLFPDDKEADDVNE